MLPMNGIDKAIVKVGGVGQLADHLDITRQAVERWVVNECVPAGWVFAVYDLTAVPLHELNGKIYPKNRVVAK